MSGVVAFEGDLNAIVKEYLEFNSLQKTSDVFEKECVEKDKPIETGEPKPRPNSRLQRVQSEMMRLFQSGQRVEFMALWKEHVPKKIRETDETAQKLEFYIYIYFFVYPFKHKGGVKEDPKWFKDYLEDPNSSGHSLCQTQEFLPYFALPFMPNPDTHSVFKPLFSDNWAPDIQTRVEKFLTLALQSTPQPRLFELYKGGNNRDAVALEQRVVESERKAQTYQKRFKRVNSDYHNLITITADLVDYLESSIQGNDVDPEYLSQICIKLFSSDVRQTTDFTRPGTAGAVLRQSVAPPQGLPHHRQHTPGTGYDYAKIKRDLCQAPDKTKCFLLQALRWKLTKSASPERDALLAAYISHDLLGCQAGQHRGDILALLGTTSSLMVQEHTARLFNTFASLVDGRSYLATNPDLVRGLLENLHTEINKESPTRSNVLGCLQKLSLRRRLQSMMIDEGIIEWLVSLLEDNDSMSDYTLEYATALLMNLCLRTSGKKRCARNANKILVVLSNLLGHDNAEILPYVNGTLYSILAVPSIREEAKAMDMEAMLEQFINPNNPDMNRQFNFIIKQLNGTEDLEDRDSDDEEEDEDEEHQDALEPDLDKDDSLKPKEGELTGDRLLNSHYVTTAPSSARSKRRQAVDGPLSQEEVLRRPVTPSHFKGSGDTGVVHIPANKTSRPPSGHSVRERPPTRSGSRGHSRKGSRPGTANIDTDAHGSDYPPATPRSSTSSSSSRRKKESSSSSLRPSQKAVDKLTGSGIAVDDHEYASAFGTRARIPRTPDVRGGSGSTANVMPPRPEYSDSLPTSRPNSGSGRPSSAGGSKRQTSPSASRTPRTPKTPSHR